ncbi:MAG: mechanosensitive ion channel [Chromatiales bacterium]|nr:mechanosensitive ion channel [Chromatiales bacterium]
MLTRFLFVLILLFSLSDLTAAPAVANVKLAAVMTEIGSVSALEARLRELEAVEEKDAPTTKALELYREALTLRKQVEEDRQLTAVYKAAIDEAPQRQARLQKDLVKVRKAAQQPSKIDPKLSLIELEQLTDQTAADLQVATRKVNLLEEELLKERGRPELSGSDLAEARRLQEELEAREKAGVVAEGIEEQAWLANLQVAQMAVTSRISRLEMERLSYPPRLEQMALRVEYERELMEQVEVRLQALQTRLHEQRTAEVERARRESEQAQRAALDKHPLLRDAAGLNTQLSEQLVKVSAEGETLQRARGSVSSQLKLVQHNLERVQQQLDIVGVDQKLGQVLRKQRQELPDLQRIENQIVSRQQVISEARLAQFQIEEQYLQLLGEESEVTELVAILPDMSDQDRQVLADELSALLVDRRTLLDALKAVYSRYESELSEIILDNRQLSDKVGQYGELLDRHLVWTPSTGRMGPSVVKEALQSVVWLLSPENWQHIAEGVMGGTPRYFVGVLLLSLLMVVLLKSRKRMLDSLEQISSNIGNVRRDSFWLTIKATLFTLLLALPWVLLVSVFLLLLVGSDPGAFVDAVTIGVRRIALLFLLVQLINYLFINHGLAEAHFRWNLQTIDIVRRNLKWLVPLLMPFVFIVGMTELQVSDLYKNSLGRLAFLISVLLLGLFAHRVLNPWSGIVRIDHGRAVRLQLLWYPLSMVIYLVLFGLAFEGYYYSALTLERLLFWSLVIGSGVFLLYNLSIRWLWVNNRRLAFSQALARRQAALDARAAKEEMGETPTGEVIPDVSELEQMNLAAISEQTWRVLRITALLSAVIGLGLLWSQLLPALTKLDDVVLWEYLQEGGQAVPVSLWDAVAAILVFALTFVAGRNLPGLLEFTLLQPLSVTAGNRYAISMISSYLIYAAGFVVFFSMIGLSWGDVQWLVAAMGVGLGFGLKEVFSNFFSGLVLLFERPLRVGDTVTVGDISGTVSRIRMRATTITDWDNKELVVPNVKFLTDPLVNWTLTDTVTRLRIKVGIAYGSDTDRAYQIIKETVEAHPDTLHEPPPAVLFLGFGDSALEYTVFAFVNDRAKRLPVLHDLHMSLNKALQAAGIGIPFPQRELHLRSVDGDLMGQLSPK